MEKSSIKKQNNYAFIDSQNMNLAIRSQGWRLDLKRFHSYLEGKYHIQKSFFFIGYVPGNEGLYQQIQEAGFICMFKPTLELPNGAIKGNVDGELIMHAMIEFKNYDRALLVTADGDFFCLARYLYLNRKLLKVLVPNQRSYSGLFKKISRPGDNIFDFMNQLREKIGK